MAKDITLKSPNGKEIYYPKTVTDLVYDNETGKTVKEILANINTKATFAGIATPTTNPGIPDSSVFYLATEAGIYTNFNGIEIAPGEAVILEWKGRWEKKVTGFATQEKLNAQKEEVDAAKEEALQAIGDAEQSAISNFNSQRVTPEMLSESTKQFIEASGGGTITNLADDEDLTVVGNVIKFADKEQSIPAYSGMARRYLRKNIVNGKNILTQEMISESQTRYIIQYDYDLNGAEIWINEGVILDFQGGSFSNGSLDCDCTYINGSINCLANLTAIKGEVVNNIHFSWLGIIGSGNKPVNHIHMRNLVNHEIKQYVVDSDVYFSENDIELPPNITINGLGHTLYFESDIYDNGCIILAQNDVLENINIISTFKGYTDVDILVANAAINKIHSFDLINVKLGQQWNKDSNYNARAIYIACDNASSETGNYITNCNLNNVNISFVSSGIEIYCYNEEKSNTEALPEPDRFAWLNEIHINNIYISATYAGIYTEFVDSATTNKAQSVGPIYVSNYEFQALTNSAKMFYHNGNWRLIINTGFCYDSIYKGEIQNGGVVVTNNVLGCFQNDDADEKGTKGYKVKDSVMIYSGKLLKDSNELATIASFRRDDFDYKSGSQYWNVGAEGQNFVIKEAAGYLSEKFFCRNNDGLSKAYTFTGSPNMQYNQNYTRNPGGAPGLMYYLSALDYGINHDKQVVLSLNRTSYDVNILESYGMTEVYEGYIPNISVDEGNIAFIKIRLNFKKDGATVSYNDIKTHFGKSTVLLSIAPRVSINGFSVMENYYRIIGNDLYIYVIAKKVDTITNMLYSFAVTYDRTFMKDVGWHREETGEVVIDALNEKYFISGHNLNIVGNYATRGATSSRPTPDAIFKNFEYFDTTLNKPIWWTGSTWVDATGTNV